MNRTVYIYYYGDQWKGTPAAVDSREMSGTGGGGKLGYIRKIRADR